MLSIQKINGLHFTFSDRQEDSPCFSLRIWTCSYQTFATIKFLLQLLHTVYSYHQNIVKHLLNLTSPNQKHNVVNNGRKHNFIFNTVLILQHIYFTVKTVHSSPRKKPLVLFVQILPPCRTEFFSP